MPACSPILGWEGISKCSRKEAEHKYPLLSDLQTYCVRRGLYLLSTPHTPWGRVRCRTQTSASLRGLLSRIFFCFESNLFLYFWLHWVFIASCRLSLVTASGGSSSLQYMDFSLQWLLLFQSMMFGLSCPMACGILPDKRSNLCPLHWQMDFKPWTTREVPH